MGRASLCSLALSAGIALPLSEAAKLAFCATAMVGIFPAAKALGSLAARPLGRSGLWRARLAGTAQMAAQHLFLASFALTIAQQLARVAHGLKHHAIGPWGNEPHQNSWLARLNHFSDIVEEAACGYQRRADAESARHPGGMTEAGAWREARDLLGSTSSSLAPLTRPSDRLAQAARLWLSRPFNPDWIVRIEDKPMSLRAAIRQGTEFEAIDQQKADYLKAGADLMDTLAERSALQANSPPSILAATAPIKRRL